MRMAEKGEQGQDTERPRGEEPPGDLEFPLGQLEVDRPLQLRGEGRLEVPGVGEDVAKRLENAVESRRVEVADLQQVLGDIAAVLRQADEAAGPLLRNRAPHRL